jgi:hypothetical protein
MEPKRFFLIILHNLYVLIINYYKNDLMCINLCVFMYTQSIVLSMNAPFEQLLSHILSVMHHRQKALDSSYLSRCLILPLFVFSFLVLAL